MENRMTAVSEHMYNQAVSCALTVSEAVDFLKREAKMRTLREKLEKFSHGQELRPILVQGLMRNHPDAKRDAVERRVRGWLNNPENRTLRQSDAIELCFILGLSVEEADAFAALISEEDMLQILAIPPAAQLKTLSKGTKEKIQLILVMSRQAQLYILDEPIAGVDPAARDYILHTIMANYDHQSSILLSTHLISDIESILDEVIFIRYGQAIMHAPAEAVRRAHGKSVDAYFREVFAC